MCLPRILRHIVLTITTNPRGIQLYLLPHISYSPQTRGWLLVSSNLPLLSRIRNRVLDLDKAHYLTIYR